MSSVHGIAGLEGDDFIPTLGSNLVADLDSGANVSGKSVAK